MHTTVHCQETKDEIKVEPLPKPLGHRLHSFPGLYLRRRLHSLVGRCGFAVSIYFMRLCMGNRFARYSTKTFNNATIGRNRGESTPEGGSHHVSAGLN